MATSNPKETSGDKKEQQMQLEAKLRAMTTAKKAVFDTTREADERLRQIRDEETRTRYQLHQMEAEEIEERQCMKMSEELNVLRRENCKLNESLRKLKVILKSTTVASRTLQKEKKEKEDEIEKLTRHIGLQCLEDKISNAEIQRHDHDDLPFTESAREMQAELALLRTENEQLKTDRIKVEQMEVRVSQHHNESLAELKENLQCITSLSETQQKKIESLLDEKFADQKVAVETQLRQLNELESRETLTEEMRQLKETLTTLHHQHQQPTTVEHRQGTSTFGSVFEGKQAKLVAQIDVEHGLLHNLEELGVITTIHRQTIEDLPARYDRRGRLLDILIMRDRELVPLFHRALKETKQKDVVRLLGFEEPETREVENVSETEVNSEQLQLQSRSHVDVLRRVYTKVSQKLNPQSVARNMFQCNALTLKELESIQSKHSEPVKAAERLLNIVMNESDSVYELFMNALKLTGQKHVCEIIVIGTDEGPENDVDHTPVIRQHYVFLVDSLDAKHSGLVSELCQAKVLNNEERESISSEMTSFTQNVKLLSMLSRKTKDQFDKFLDALDKTGQQHVRNQLTGRQEQDTQEIQRALETEVNAEQLQLQQQLQQANETIAKLLEQRKPTSQSLTVPGRPSILGVHDVLSSRCTVIYLPPDNDGGAAVIGYLLERRSPGLEWIRFNDTPVTGLKYVVDNLAPLTEYQFRVAAVNMFGISSFSEASEMITTKAPSVPDQPRWPVVVKLIGTSVTLEWTAPPSDAEISSYMISYGVPGTDIAKYSAARYDGQTTSCTLTKLKPKTKYHFAVAAENEIGRGPLSIFSECVITHKQSDKSVRFTKRPKCVKSFKPGGVVRGVTQLGDIVYAVCEYSPVIKMFTADTLSPLGKVIRVEGMRDPSDIVACHHDRQLYVADEGGECIWRVSVSDDHHSYVKWLTGIGVRNVYTLSLTSHHLLVTSRRPSPRVRQYDTTDGQLVREVPLPSYVKYVFHAAETSRDTFVLCHEGTSVSKDQHAVSELFGLCRRSALK